MMSVRIVHQETKVVSHFYLNIDHIKTIQQVGSYPTDETETNHHPIYTIIMFDGKKFEGITEFSEKEVTKYQDASL